MNYTISRPQTIGGFGAVSQKSLVLPTEARMYIVAACAFLVVLQSSLSDDFSSMWVALAAVLAALLTEALICLVTGRRTIYDGSVIVTALVLAMLLPNRIHPGFAVFGAAFAIAVVRYPSGGLGSNWLNPALGGALAVRFSWTKIWQTSLETAPLDPVSYPPVASGLSANGEAMSEFLNEHVFALFEVRLPPTYVDLFTLPSAGIIADRGIFALIVGSVIIVSCVTFRGWMPFLYLAAYLFLVRIAGMGVQEADGDMFYALCSGGTLVTAFYLLSDPVTGSKSNAGSVIYVLAAAVLTFVFRFLHMEFYGAFFAIALLNTMLPILRVLERRILYERRISKEELKKWRLW
ncbi:MAG: RnfABCDGE type electron transport complex subunit D [Spirochaetaceae bacterium]|jgi:electron transport complex protein RnfD|nr:RnfABCDGE type electron transport complex subunit D [Spirochaetaceae bacterium]